MDSRRRVAAVAAATVLIAVPALAADKPPQKKGATYSGVTSQGRNCYFQGKDGEPCSVSVNVSDDGKQVKLAQVYWRAPCNGGIVYRSNTLFHELKINDKAKYKNSSSYVETLSDGARSVNAVKTHGEFRRNKRTGKRKLVGDFSVEADLTGADGSKYHCKSGEVTFTAKIK